MSRPTSLLGGYTSRAYVRKEQLLIVLKTYFDSSGSITNSPFLTLSAIAANDALWAEIEEKWASMLRDRSPDATYVHMVEASHLREGFKKDSGWNDQKVERLLSDLIVFMSSLDQKFFHQFAIVVNMEDYRRLQSEGYQMPSPVELCVEGCIATMIEWYTSSYKGLDVEMGLYFDRNEPFEPVFRDKWNEQLDRSRELNKHSIWEHFSEVASVSMKAAPGIQIADMLGWGLNRQLSGRVQYSYLATAMCNFMPATVRMWNGPSLRRSFDAVRREDGLDY